MTQHLASQNREWDSSPAAAEVRYRIPSQKVLMSFDARTSEKNAGGVVNLPQPRDPAYQDSGNDSWGLGGPRTGSRIGYSLNRFAKAEVPVFQVRGETGLIPVVNR